MPTPPPLTQVQKSRLADLEPALRNAVYAGDYARAKNIASDIQVLLRATGHETRLMQAKNWLFEAALNAGEYSIAEAGFRGVCKKTAENTRVHLTAKSLLVVCLLRQKKSAEAESVMAKVLEAKAIRSADKRREFIESVLGRYRMESYISEVRGWSIEEISADSVDAEAIEAVRTKSEEELYLQIAAALPKPVIEAVYRVNEAARKQLTMQHSYYLPAPVGIERNISQGKSFFSSLKLVIWKSLCDKESEVYKAWYTNGVSQVLSKKYYAIVVTSALIDLGFAAKAVAVPVTALLMRFGLDVYCERFRPGEILDGRGDGG